MGSGFGRRGSGQGVKRDEWTWKSPALDREMSVCRWGHFGKPVVLFPTAGGDYLECERFLMIKAIEPLIDHGDVDDVLSETL